MKNDTKPLPKEFNIEPDELIALFNGVKNEVINELYRDGHLKEKLEPDLLQMKYLIILARKHLFGKRFDELYFKDDKDGKWTWKLVESNAEQDVAEKL